MEDKKVEALRIVEDETEVLPAFSRTEHETWFDGNIHHYKTLAAMVAATLKSTLDGHGISYVNIPFREKEKKSFLKKIDDKNKNKDYSPKDMTDLAGIRVITLIESDVQKVGELIHSLFNVHLEDSVNKSASLGEDKVGYRSVHFVCDIGETRENLLEWQALKGLCFEIQVRTALEHAWAEIEHDRGYKLGGKLPSDLARRFSLLSGLLESADLEFNRLSVEIEAYANNVINEIKENNGLNIELSTIGINTLIKNKYKQIDYKEKENEDLIEILSELSKFGINNLQDLDSLIKENIEYLQLFEDITTIGIIRHSMILSDIEKYFQIFSSLERKAWKGIRKKSYEILRKKYDTKYLNQLLISNNIKILDK